MSKLDKRAISIFVIAILALSFALPLVGVSAAETYIDADLVSSGIPAYAVWALDPVSTPGKLWVAEISIDAGSQYAQVRIYPDTTLTLSGLDAELTADPITYDYCMKSGEATDHPDIELRFEDSAGDGWVEIGLYTYEPTITPDIWNTVQAYDLNGGSGVGNGHVTAWGSSNGILSDINFGGSKSTSDIVTAVVGVAAGAGTWVLERIAIQVGYGQVGPLTAFVDFIHFDGTDYELETVVPGTGFTIDYVTPGDVDYGDVLTVIGSGVTSGSEVKLFWDTAIGTGAHLLNTTEGNPDGTFDSEIKVPSDHVGNHYLWVVDVASATSESYGPITMIPKISLSPSSGLEHDTITVKGYGFSADSDVTITFDGTVLTSTVETDELGYFTYKFDIPVPDYGTYPVVATDEKSKTDSANFILGASIILTPDEGPTGSKVKVDGRGWTKDETMSFAIGTTTVEVVELKTITVKSDGTFTADVIIPDVASTGDYEIEATETDVGADGAKGPSHDHFDVTGIPKLVVSPTYGTPGATITVKGYNFTQIAGTDIELILKSLPGVTPVVTSDLHSTAETKADGTFEETFISPAITFQTYTITATDDYYIDADDAFKVGLIALIINPIYGEAGTQVSITGIGFATGVYNVTFGTKLYEDYADVTSGEAISDLFYVPNFEPGTYDLTISDTDENELTVQYSLTESTYVIANPAVAPNDYNVSLKGYHFADIKDGLVDFVIYNATADGKVDKEWDMDVDTDPGKVAAATDADGNFTAYWIVRDKDTLSIGDYTINVTGSKGLLVQVPFSVVAARVSVAPRKAQFDRGDMIQFDIENDFRLEDSYIDIYDPYDTLYWSTDKFEKPFWLLVEGLYTVPYYRQTAAENPMELQSDAPMGAWLYIFYDMKDKQLMNGTFSVGPSTSAQVEEKLTQLWGSLEDLTENIDSITDEIAGDIADLSGDIDDVVADVQDMIDDISGDLAADLAKVAADTEAAVSDAVSDIEADIGDIADAQNQLASELEDMGQDTTAARQAAEDAQGATQGLTGIVYGAIGCSLIAALAAIVSLMQISKKIA